MTFTQWLNALGEVVTNMLAWIGSCFNYLKDNYIILTMLGIGLFIFIINLLLKLIGSMKIDRYQNKTNLDNPKGDK